MSGYTILETTPAIYQDQVKGIVNGVLVRFRMDKYNEVHEVRVPEMKAEIVKAAIEKMIKERDALSDLSSPVQPAGE